MDSGAKKVLILTSDTGGGHRASAEAVRDAFAERYGAAFRVELVDLWMKYTPPPLSQVPKGYRFLVDDVPWLYQFIYEAGQKPQVIEPLMNAATCLLQGFVSRAVEQCSPDLIVSVHPLMQQVPLQVLARTNRRIPFSTVVTDLVTIPPVWFAPGATLCFVPSDEGYRLAERAGLREGQLRQHGLPIRPAFARPGRPKAELREKFGMVQDVPAALIVGGGEGMGPVGEIAHAVAQRLAAEDGGPGRPAGQLAVICGRNQALQDELEAAAWPVPTVIQGFVEEIWDWMAACDCVLTKAGPGTIAEASALGLPMLLTGYIRGQESGNVPYVLRHGIGAYVEDPWQIGEVVSGWFGPQRDTLELLAERARQLGRPRATFAIVADIAKLAGVQ